MRAQWDHRNAGLHGRRTKEESHAIRHAWLMDQADTQCAQGTSMLAVDGVIIAEPMLQQSKTKPPLALTLWLGHTIPILKLGTTSTTAAITKTYKKITSFFRRKRPPELSGETHPNKLDPEKSGWVCNM